MRQTVWSRQIRKQFLGGIPRTLRRSSVRPECRTHVLKANRQVTVEPGMSEFFNFMELALVEAAEAADRGEVPVGAAVVGPDNAVLAAAGNRCREFNDATAHAEMLAIRLACRSIGSHRLDGASLYVTLEPCAMCAGAISLSRISRLYFGAEDPKSGGVEHGARVFSHPQCHHRPDVYGGIGAAASESLLDAFFRVRRREFASP